MKNKILKIIALVIGGYTLIGFIILPLIMKSQIEKNLNEMLIPEVSLNSVSFNPFTLQLSLNEFLIKDEKKELIKFKTFHAEFSLLKSLHKRYASFKEIRLSQFHINIIQNKDGSINLLSLLKEQQNNTKQEEKVKKEEKGNTPFPFKISKMVLDNANIHLSLLNGDEPLNLNLKEFNYTFYELGTYKNSLASHSLNTIINKDTQLKVNGGFHLMPFKMYGNIEINNLRTNDYIPYRSDLLKFQLSDALVNLKLGYQVDLSQGVKAQLDNTYFELKNLSLLQNNKTFTGLKSLQINNLSLRYPEQVVNIDAININDLFAHALIDKEGHLNFANLVKQQDGHRIKKIKEKRQTKKDIWNLTVQNINLNNANIQLNDKKSRMDIKTNALNINLNDVALIDNQIKLNQTTLNVNRVSLNDKKNRTTIKSNDIKLNLDDLSLIKNHITLHKATLNIHRFNLNDKQNKKTLSSNKFSLFIEDVSKKENEIKLNKLTIKQPFARINNPNANIITKNLNLNVYDILNKDNYLQVKKSLLSRPKISITVKKKPEKQKKEEQKKAKEKNNATSQTTKSNMNLNIGPFNISKANIIFEDKNLPIPFKTNISQLNGNFSELITKSSKPTKLHLEGQVDQYGYTKITGLVDHKNIKNLTDVQLLFKNIAIKNFTPYSGKFVGRELSGGKLNLNLKYNITKSSIDATNSIVITDIELGKTVQNPNAMSLPLELAIALMQDSNGVIDLNVPISGNVDDPQFSIAPIVWKAFTNLIVKAITSPFSFLASLFDFDEEEIKSVEFAYGNAQLIASEKETLDKIAQIFKKRPNIALKVQPTIDTKKDSYALKSLKFDTFIDQVIKKIKKGEDKYLIALEQSYNSYKEELSLKGIKKEITQKDKEKKFNKEMYVEYLKEYLIQKQTLLPKELNALAINRANALSTYLNTAHKIKANRVQIKEEIQDMSQSKDWVIFNLEIGVTK